MRLFEGTQWDVPPRCDRCEELEADCQCPPPVNIVDPSSQKLKIRVEKRKRGKVVTVICGLANDDARTGLLTDLKNLVGSGGTIREDNLEIQGDHVANLSSFLAERGYVIQGR